MTGTPELVEHTTPAPPRMKNKGYAVVPQDGNRLEGYTRSTTISSAVDDKHFLIGHTARGVVAGLARRPDLVARAATTDPADTRALTAIYETAFDAAGGNVKRDLGTALHNMFERATREPGAVFPEPFAADLAAAFAALDAAAFDILPDYSECIVVLDAEKVAGRPDGFVRCRHTGAVYVFDLKTGAKLYPLGFSVQLSAYVDADNVYAQGAAADGSQDERRPMPANLDRSRGLILHAPAGTGTAELVWLDLDTGREARALAHEIRRRRSTAARLVTPFADSAPTIPNAGPSRGLTGVDVVGSVESNNHTAGAVPDSSPGDGTGVAAAGEPSPGDTSDLVDRLAAARVEWVLARLGALTKAGHTTPLARAWADNPTLTDAPRPAHVRDNGAAWTAAQLEAVVDVAAQVERAHEMPFAAPDPGKPAPAAKPAAGPGPVARPEQLNPDREPGTVDTALVRELRAKLRSLTRERRAAVDRWTQEGNDHGADWNIGGTPPVLLHRWAIASAALTVAAFITDTGDETLARAAVDLVLDNPADLARFPTGAVLGVLTVDQADRLTTELAAGDNGNPRLTADQQQRKNTK
jgi:hypothetical protein